MGILPTSRGIPYGSMDYYLIECMNIKPLHFWIMLSTIFYNLVTLRWSDNKAF